MALTNSAQRYGSVTKTFHWTTALLILTLIPLGIYANDLPYDTSEELARKALVFSLHKTLGVTMFFVALARIAWAVSQPKPGLLHPDRRIESLAAEVVHWLLYGSLLVVPLSGWVHHAATTGFAPIWWPFGQNLPFVPKDEAVASAAAGLHIVFERVLIVSLLLHFAGAMKHHFIDKDVTLRRMLPGRIEAVGATGGHRMALPVTAALGVWAAALLAGGALGLYAPKENTVAAAALEAVQSDWVVQDGTLALSVQQMGSEVTGSFSDWTAAIRFDETVQEGPAGSVEVTISIGSLTLGSVTNQAMGADFFNAENFPTATFAAEILRDAQGYRADGTLTIKDRTTPVSLPFTLELADGLARMTGSTAVDRRDYGVGDTQKDEASVGFTVGIDVALTARSGQ